MKLTVKILKAAGKELEEIVQPMDDNDEPISLGTGKVKDMKVQIKEAAAFLTPEDDISKELHDVLVELGAIKVPDAEEDSKESEELTWDVVNNMSRIELSKLCEEKELVTDPDDYDENALIDFREDVALEIGIEVPEEEQEEEQVKETSTAGLIMDINSCKKLQELKDLISPLAIFKEINPDDFKGLSGARELKKVVMGILTPDQEEVEKPKEEEEKTESKAKKEEKPKEKEKPKKKKITSKKVTYTRINAVIDSIKSFKKEFTQKDVQNKSDNIYCKKTKTPSFDTESKKMHPATHIVNYIVTGLVAFGILSEANKKYKFNK